MSKCFADTNGITCQILKKRKCKGCNFFKTQQQVNESREKALKRIKSLDEPIRNNIVNLYGLESLQ